MRAQDFQGIKIYRIPEGDRKTRKDGTPRQPKKLGKVHFPVFTPDGMRVVGFMVAQPDVVGMIKQPDRFIARDAVRVYEGVFGIPDRPDSFDRDAAKRLGIDLDQCIIFTGMDVMTVSGEKLGYCSDAEFDGKTGAVSSFSLTTGAAASALVGAIEMPASYLKAYRDGVMYVDDAALDLGYSGGIAAKAGEASAKVTCKAQAGAEALDERSARAIERGGVVMERGARTFGKQLGKTRGMFTAFKDEFKKASGSSSSSGKKR